MNNKITSFKEYFEPSDKILSAINDLQNYYFVTHQEYASLYLKNQDKNSFKGNLVDYIEINKIKELLGIDNNLVKPIISTIFLLKYFQKNFDTLLLSQLNKQDANTFYETIKKGYLAKEVLEKWIKPLQKGDILQSIEDASKVDLNKTFQILKLQDLQLEDGKEIGLYPYLLEIESAEEMVYFLKLQKNINNCLLVTIQRNKNYDWKSFFYLFLIYKGILYSIDNSDHRLNQDNTEGCRNPDSYLERHFDKVWLPINLLWNKKVSKSKELMIKESKVYRLQSFEKIGKEQPEIIYWLINFLYRCIDHIKNKEVAQGITVGESPKLIEWANKKEFRGDDYSGAGQFLYDHFKKECKDLIITEKNLPVAIGTKDFVENLLGYKRRQLQADLIQKKINEDYEKNHEQVYNWIETFVKKINPEVLVKRTLEDNEYSYMKYPGFTEERIIELRKEKILKVSDGYYGNGLDKNELDVTEQKHWRDKQYCYVCNKVLYKKELCLRFRDYRQFLEFFNLKENEIPEQMKLYLHHQLEMYVGNSLLDDTDPVDELRCSWFSEHEHQYGGTKFDINIPVCNRCIKKLSKP